MLFFALLCVLCFRAWICWMVMRISLRRSSSSESSCFHRSSTSTRHTLTQPLSSWLRELLYTRQGGKKVMLIQVIFLPGTVCSRSCYLRRAKSHDVLLGQFLLFYFLSFFFLCIFLLLLLLFIVLFRAHCLLLSFFSLPIISQRSTDFRIYRQCFVIRVRSVSS